MAEHGHPDGCTIDADDNIWVALWGGWAVRCYSPRTGEVCAGVQRVVCEHIVFWDRAISNHMLLHAFFFAPVFGFVLLLSSLYHKKWSSFWILLFSVFDVFVHVFIICNYFSCIYSILHEFFMHDYLFRAFAVSRVDQGCGWTSKYGRMLSQLTLLTDVDLSTTMFCSWAADIAILYNWKFWCVSTSFMLLIWDFS